MKWSPIYCCRQIHQIQAEYTFTRTLYALVSLLHMALENELKLAAEYSVFQISFKIIVYQLFDIDNHLGNQGMHNYM